MYIIVDERELVTTGYRSGFDREGVSAVGFDPSEFNDWISGAAEEDLGAVEAILIGDCQARETLPRLVKSRCKAPVIAMNDTHCLEQTLGLFAAGVDDVVRKPVHVKEIMARVGAFNRRIVPPVEDEAAPTEHDLQVFFDGRDPIVRGEVLTLPRRERRILEYLVKNKGKRVQREQIFSAVYGVFNENVDEAVVESHISKLRKKLRGRLGYDPIDSKRYLGYMFS
ncbi:response regulator transcription factor [Salinarimonas ramus]|uniref:Transcriptional regulator n=1 Tax=Salinarimonas ramus TaxID=690164 RepID=A0A917Q9L7_9HYPH|nr:response regulator transcription factor [Salinarimonas ramus]GGK34396.1 transcriptional regulator [Salinarimonas ramus]